MVGGGEWFYYRGIDGETCRAGVDFHGDGDACSFHVVWLCSFPVK